MADEKEQQHVEKKLPAFLKTVYLSNREIRLILAGLYSLKMPKEEIEEKINLEANASRDVLVEIVPRDVAFQIPDLIRTKINLLPKGIREVRTVEIVGLDLQADGGTHVANTAEVGVINVVDYKSKGRINKRIVVEIGESKS